MTRLVVLAVAIVFVAGLTLLTVGAAVRQGVTLGSLVAIFVIVLLFVGIVGALRNPPR